MKKETKKKTVGVHTKGASTCGGKSKKRTQNDST